MFSRSKNGNLISKYLPFRRFLLWWDIGACIKNGKEIAEEIAGKLIVNE